MIRVSHTKTLCPIKFRVPCPVNCFTLIGTLLNLFLNFVKSFLLYINYYKLASFIYFASYTQEGVCVHREGIRDNR